MQERVLEVHLPNERGWERPALDFADVDLMNSAGISLLFGILTESHQARQRLAFVGLTPHHPEVLI